MVADEVELAQFIGRVGAYTGRVHAAVLWHSASTKSSKHTHPLGQTLLIVQSLGRVQREGGRVEEVHPGDVVRFAPGERHWHGGAPATAMSDMAFQEVEGGTAVTWMEQVGEEAYRSPGPAWRP